MLVNPITNRMNSRFAGNIDSPSFQGTLGRESLKDFGNAVIYPESSMKTVWKRFMDAQVKNKSGLKKLLVKIGLGAWGFISMSKFYDILYEWQSDFSYEALIVKNLESNLSEVQSKKAELETKLVEKEEEIKEREDKISKRTANLNIIEQVLDTDQEALSKHLTELKGRQEEIAKKENELKTRTDELNKREQNIEKTTVARVTGQIRKEEQDKANKAYEEKIKALETKEQSLNEKEKVLINTENIIRQAEVEKIKGELRVFYGIQDTENKSYSSFGEQMVAVASILNNSRSFDSKNQLTLRYITEALQDNEGTITAEKLQFLERILNLDDEIKEGYLHSFICLAQDESGNLDSEKAAYLIAALSWNKEGHQKVIDDFAEYYHLKSTYENQPREELFMTLINQAVFDENMPDTELLEKIKNLDYLQECDKPSLIFANKKIKGSYLWLNQEDDSTSFKLIKQIIENLERIINFKTVKGE